MRSKTDLMESPSHGQAGSSSPERRIEEGWQAAEMLTSPDMLIREQGLDLLQNSPLPGRAPLIAYLLADRLTDPELSIRRQSLKILGGLLAEEQQACDPGNKVIRHLHGALLQFTREDYLKMLEVSREYLSAEDDLIRVLRLCSFAGRHLSGIVYDRKTDLALRQKAIYFAGRVGIMEVREMLERLVQRVERIRDQADQQDRSLPGGYEELEALYPYAAGALLRLRTSPKDSGEEG